MSQLNDHYFQVFGQSEWVCPWLSLVFESAAASLLFFQSSIFHPHPLINVSVHWLLTGTPPPPCHRILHSRLGICPMVFPILAIPSLFFHVYNSYVSFTVKFKSHVYHVPFPNNAILYLSSLFWNSFNSCSLNSYILGGGMAIYVSLLRLP